jgi:signal transduction histidine kinase
MPEHDGIEVLDFARVHQGDAVRILLTGYLDERAHDALLRPDAPYKVGKPWHDEVEVTVRRGLEQREFKRQLSASVEDALSLSSFDEELATASTPAELGDVIIRRALSVEGVTACGTTGIEAGEDELVAGSLVPQVGSGWYLDLPLDVDGEHRLKARGVGEGARQLVAFMVHRAHRRCGLLEARVPSSRVPSMAGTRLNQLMRQATIGALTGSLLHDLASTMQALSIALSEISSLSEGAAPELVEAVEEASAAGNEAVQLFVQMRKFIRAGEVTSRKITLAKLVERAVKLAGGYVRERARLVVEPLPEAELDVSESLLLQVLSNLLRNAANISPPAGTITVSARVLAAEVSISVTDDGPGVAPEIADHMFETFASTTQESTGLGLAISAHVMSMSGGGISYRKSVDRGAVFTISLPRVLPTQADGPVPVQDAAPSSSPTAA